MSVLAAVELLGRDTLTAVYKTTPNCGPIGLLQVGATPPLKRLNNPPFLSWKSRYGYRGKTSRSRLVPALRA